MIVQIDDWKFQIDMERTMEYSAAEAADHCDCAYCRNFYAAVDDAFPELRLFLALFGVDLEAPEEMLPVFFDDGSICYDPSYRVYGKILQPGMYEMAAGYCNLVAQSSDENDYFLLHCYEVFLHWHLEEPLEDVISPANQPSLLARSIEKLLGNTSKGKIPS